MNVPKINNNQPNRKIITPKTTGYAATIALGGAVVSGISKNRVLKKTHKTFAYLSAIFVAMHIAIMKSYHRQYKKM